MASDLAGALTFARRVARRAGAAAMAHYGTAEASSKQGGSPVTEADHAANAIIIQAIREAYPADAILSEESKDSPDRLKASRVWIVDPLDGTKEFLAQNGEFSIMIGLALNGEAVLGVVYMPDGDRLYSAARGLGATLEVDQEVHGLRTDKSHYWPPRMVGSRSHADEMTLRIRDALGVTDVAPSGSVGVKCALIAEGKRDLYVHPVPYLKEWDTCAPEVVLREAGGCVVDCLGERLSYNKQDPRQPHGILACAPGILERAKDTIRTVYESGPAGHEAVA